MKKIPYQILILLLPILTFAQKTISISGQVLDKDSNNPIPFINIYLKHSKIGTTSSINGFFKLIIPENSNNDSIYFAALSYSSKITLVKELKKSNNIKIFLKSKPYKIEQVQVIGKKINPKKLLKKAKKKVTENYPQKPYIAECYYRMYVSSNEKIVKLKELSIDYLDDIKRSEILTCQMAHRVNATISKGNKKHLNYFNSICMNNWNMKKWIWMRGRNKYSMDTIYYLGNDIIYVVKVQPKGKIYTYISYSTIDIETGYETLSLDSIYEKDINKISYSKYYVNLTDLAVIKKESFFSQDTASYGGNGLYSFKCKSRYSSLTFQKYMGKYYPKKLSEIRSGFVKMKKEKQTYPIDFNLKEFYINTIVTDSLEIEKQRAEFKKGFSEFYSQKDIYSKKFWDNYKYIISDKIRQKAFNGLYLNYTD